MREINFENCIKYIMLVKQLVGDVVGNAWLSKELEKIGVHP